MNCLFLIEKLYNINYIFPHAASVNWWHKKCHLKFLAICAPPKMSLNLTSWNTLSACLCAKCKFNGKFCYFPISGNYGLCATWQVPLYHYCIWSVHKYGLYQRTNYEVKIDINQTARDAVGDHLLHLTWIQKDKSEIDPECLLINMSNL